MHEIIYHMSADMTSDKNKGSNCRSALLCDHISTHGIAFIDCPIHQHMRSAKTWAKL